MTRRVLVVQRRMTHYRVPFFEALRRRLGDRGMELQVAYGEPTEDERRKHDGGELEWGVRLPTRYLLGGRICWQPFPRLLDAADLVVITAENKLLYNLAVQFLPHRRRVALWGHGANLQGNPSSLRERFKRRVARRADWWFAYTGMSVPLIERSGFPHDRITVLNNAIDTHELATQYAAVSAEEIASWRHLLALRGGHVGIFVGSLHADKRIDFLLEAAAAIRAAVPDFELLVVGDGPLRASVVAFCEREPWVKYLGARRGKEKAELMALARTMLNPGMVGLGILDAFVCEVPLVTTDCGIHSPEIAYLANGVNGLLTPDSLDDYVRAVASALTNADQGATLRAGCRASAAEYTVDRMAGNFAVGAERCLTSRQAADKPNT